LNSLIAVLGFDARSLSREQLLGLIVVLLVLGVGVLSFIGWNQADFGVESMRQWIPYLLILSIIANTASFGMVIAVLLIEEVESGVRSAVLTTPFPPATFLIARTLILVVALTITGFVTGLFLDVAWSLQILSPLQWLALSFVTALVGPAVMLSLSAVAANRLEAMAIGKFYSWIVTAPMLIYFLPLGEWYRHLFLILPTTPMINAFEAFRDDQDVLAYTWLLWGTVYSILLAAIAVRQYINKAYHLA